MASTAWSAVVYSEGVSRDLLDLAVERKIIEKGGAWFA
jgi:hypothetical protein